jgi:hypothetical protein
MSEAAVAGQTGERIALLKVLGPIHVWALGVGIVLVGEFMGWNFSVAKGGAYGSLIACWIIGLLYTCVAMIDSEVTSTVAAAGGQYTQAKHIIGPLMADRPAAELPLGLFDPHVRTIFDDPRSKELLVTRHGVRIVYQAHSADRSEYLVLRSAALREAHVPAVLLKSILDQAVAVCADLVRGGAHAQA